MPADEWLEEELWRFNPVVLLVREEADDFRNGQLIFVK
jgi:hypothetical protein